MAIQLLKENDRFNTYHQHFLVDSSDDLTSLEANFKCQMGDVAEAVDGTKYVRHSDGYSGDLWEEVGSSGSSSGSSDSGDDSIYAVVVLREFDPDGQLPDTISIVKGTFAETQSKLTAREPVIALIYTADRLNGDIISYGNLSFESVSGSDIEFSDPVTGTFYAWTADGIEIETEG